MLKIYLLALFYLPSVYSIIPNFPELLIQGDSLSGYSENTISLPKNIAADSSKNISLDTNLYITEKEFYYANQYRVSLDGKLPYRKTQIKPITAGIVFTIAASSLVALHIHQRNTWWSGTRTAFHFQEDWVSALQADKFGHAYGTYITSYYAAEAFSVSGLSWEDANIYGGLFGLACQTFVETEDGYAKDWGFSPSDWYFDAIGSLFFIAQYKVPYLQNFTPKLLWFPSELQGKPKIDRPRTIIDDYNSESFWISANVHNLLEDDLKKYWPEWLFIAVGYGADAIDVIIDPNGPVDQLSKRRFMISLDFSITKLLPKGGTQWNWWVQSLDRFKWPSPTIEFTKGRTKFYLVYPIRIDLGQVKL